MSGLLACKVKDKNKTYSYGQKQFKLKVHNFFPLLWVSGHCESKMEKQNLHAAEN